MAALPARLDLTEEAIVALGIAGCPKISQLSASELALVLAEPPFRVGAWLSYTPSTPDISCIHPRPCHFKPQALLPHARRPLCAASRSASMRLKPWQIAVGVLASALFLGVTPLTGAPAAPLPPPAAGPPTSCSSPARPAGLLCAPLLFHSSTSSWCSSEPVLPRTAAVGAAFAASPPRSTPTLSEQCTTPLWCC